MLEFLVDNIFVNFAGKVSQQTVGIPMGTNYAPLLADSFLYSYEAEAETETINRPFLKIKFANKGIDALNFSNILNQKSVQSNIPPYFQNKESPCISYSYTRSVASKFF